MNIDHYETGKENTVQQNAIRPVQSKKRRKGRYLSQNRPAQRRRRRKLNPRFVVLVTVLLLTLICIAMGIRSCTKPTLKGRWDLDGVTVYEFRDGGKGALVLMAKEYEFKYQIEGNQLSIDFVDDMALDAKYTFEMNGQMLFLTGGPGDAKSEYILQKLQ